MELSELIERIPHRGPMRFIDEVVAVKGATIRTRTTLREDFLMLDGGKVSPMVAIELFAQSAALFMAHRSSASDVPFVQGALLGSRTLDADVPFLAVGDTLEVEAEEVFGAGNLAQFKCRLFREGTEIARGAINVASGANVVRG